MTEKQSHTNPADAGNASAGNGLESQPAGWRMVPLEPTIGMCIAGDEARWSIDDCTRTPAIYRAMLAAAPQPPQAEAVAQHPDDAAVDRFAAAMKAKLAASRAKGRSGWDDQEQCTLAHLARLLVVHIPKGDPVDVANFAMMLHQRGAGRDVLANAAKTAPPASAEESSVAAEPFAYLHYARKKPNDCRLSFAPIPTKQERASGWVTKALGELSKQPVPVAPHPPQATTPKPLDDPRLQELFMSAITGAIMLGYQNTNPPPAWHWLQDAWDIGRAEAKKLEDFTASVTAPQPAPQERRPLTDERTLDLATDFSSTCLHAGVMFDDFDILGFGLTMQRACAEAWGVKLAAGSGEAA